MKKSFQYRLYPTKFQITEMRAILEDCRWLYNHFLGERKNAYEQDKRSISHYDQLNSIKDIKEHVDFTAYSQTLQNVGTRVDLAYQVFFRRCKSGEKPGYPRFKSYGRYDSFTYPQSGFELVKNNIYLSKIGNVKIKLHRPIKGTIKTVVVKRTPTNKWFITFSCDNAKPSIKHGKGTIGIDVGLQSFATLSDGSKIENPKFFKKSEKALACSQRRLSNTDKHSRLRKSRRLIVSRIHEHISNRRKDFVYKISNNLVKKYKTICVEDLDVNRMGENKKFSKSIHDVAWAIFFQVLAHKAEEAGGQVIPVNPAYTSQDCSKCGTRILKSLDERIHRCSCGLVLDRDHNAALNILAMGLHGLVVKPRSPQL